MRAILAIVVCLSLLLNLYYYAVLTYISLAYDSYEAKVDQFPTFFGHIPATNTLLFLVLFTLISMVTVGIRNIFHHRGRVLFVVVQTVAFAFYLWQLM